MRSLLNLSAATNEFGSVERVKLSKIQKLAGGFFGRNWVTIPHVTHNDKVDIEAVEERRTAYNAIHADAKLTLLPLLLKAMVSALKAFPRFNASLSENGAELAA